MIDRTYLFFSKAFFDHAQSLFENLFMSTICHKGGLIVGVNGFLGAKKNYP